MPGGTAAAWLQPLSWLYAATARLLRRPPEAVPVPVVVVGNLVVGGAGKTPTVLALLQLLQRAGWRPGVVSRGYGRSGDAVHAVEPRSSAADVGDEPLLIRRRAGVPVWVGRHRAAAVHALCVAHPDVDIVVADDGLQHRALPRVLEIAVFDERGAGNGLLLPAGPLREPLRALHGAPRLVLYNAAATTTPLPGAVAQRALAGVRPLAAWLAGDAAPTLLTALRGRPLVAAAGIAVPERCFAMLEAAGLTITRLPLPDHHPYATLPWPADAEVVVTEKDAVKLGGAPGRIWVAALDLSLPAAFAAEVLRRLPARRRR